MNREIAENAAELLKKLKDQLEILKFEQNS